MGCKGYWLCLKCLKYGFMLDDTKIDIEAEHKKTSPDCGGWFDSNAVPPSSKPSFKIFDRMEERDVTNFIELYKANGIGSYGYAPHYHNYKDFVGDDEIEIGHYTVPDMKEGMELYLEGGKVLKAGDTVSIVMKIIRKSK